MEFTNALCTCRHLNFLLRQTKGKGQDVSLYDDFAEQAGYCGPLKRWVDVVVVNEQSSTEVDVQIFLTSLLVKYF
jgi:hypothetical protein